MMPAPFIEGAPVLLVKGWARAIPVVVDRGMALAHCFVVLPIGLYGAAWLRHFVALHGSAMTVSHFSL